MKTPRASAVALVSSAALLAAGALGANPIPFPHPQITEVLFNVPTGEEGDASGDGTRDAAGDEFIEIANPHREAINLKGYTLSSRLSAVDRPTGKGVRFVFPDCELPPHGVAIVFNGYSTALPEPSGDAERAPEGPNRRFGGALVFSARNGSKSSSLSNSGDFILLSAPDGSPIDALWWGDPSPRPPRASQSEEVKAQVKGSVQRIAPGADMRPHTDIDGKLFSPGSIPRDSGAGGSKDGGGAPGTARGKREADR